MRIQALPITRCSFYWNLTFNLLQLHYLENEIGEGGKQYNMILKVKKISQT